MTEENAIKMLRGMKSDNLNLNDLYTSDKYEALDMAIKVIEKDMPKAPKKRDTPRYGMGYDYYDWCCPSCGKFLAYECDSEREKIHHCRCGQRLKWKEREE